MQLREDLEQYLNRSLENINDKGRGTIGAMMQLEVIDCDPQAGVVRMRGKTEPWMQNFKGALHGGISATLVDQAMGCVAYAVKLGQGGFTTTINMQLSYHRPLIPGEDPIITVRPTSVTKSLISLSAEVVRPSEPEKICVSATATFFYKPPQA